ncbi:Radical SAM domain protein [Methanococcus vannielii SB]|uniref:7,8-didemethyl-8-hydroxy-5-deazariboflavin synthase n=1 Tax=Methanococcus vannielii (strain ATCC 35089 / DSM 1224 / JCM 13029 / OCM 148 / SB) TaxID=406327 RepID=COFG_METVS|nr:7,8-didemethyl-8-hydroxy-5-deazariboflavin synthase subunit CofG [Methanococcus vannielii]A6UN87.1 RecName: Full=7,8-didemethyl-8-hydroxy-5-deazariboflavin synthase; AltName: Full=FO synthase subunit 1 [Methanococcus vannielii SB]ABR53959.1 Radical SAM domain protein [Methanococcus vannielii SB]
MLTREKAIEFLNSNDTGPILEMLNLINGTNNGKNITYSKNAFIPVCNWCRNICGYCTFRAENFKIMTKNEVKEILLKADSLGCREALFTFGENVDENELVREKLIKMGYKNILEYLYDLCDWCLSNTNILPHTNCGILNYDELKYLRKVNVSMGLMLENSSERLCKTVAHEKSPGKNPKLRIEMIENAGKLKIPFTTGILIGIGETFEERINSIFEIKRMHEKYGHIQEVIIQNFRVKKGIPMENFIEPSPIEMFKMVMISKLILEDISIQVPPNLNRETGQLFLMGGIDDFGGVSPLTKDYVNPEAPWPDILELERFSNELGFKLKERLPIYEKYINENWIDSEILKKLI